MTYMPGSRKSTVEGTSEKSPFVRMETSLFKNEDKDNFCRTETHDGSEHPTLYLIPQGKNDKNKSSEGMQRIKLANFM
jgi:hypothetical protein